MQPTIQIFAEHDVAFAVSLATGFGWTTSPAWFRVFLSHDPAGCFVARIGDEPIGMVTTTRYTTSAWVGYLMVSPQRGRLGLGTKLLEHALDHLDMLGVATVQLDADPPGVRIYQRHGFVEQFQSRRFRLVGPAQRRLAAAVPLTPDELPAAARLDLESLGDDRTRLLGLLYQGAEAAFCVRRQGRLSGYALLIPSRVGVHLGPWIAEDRSAAAELLAAALRRSAGRAVTVGVPGPNRDAVDLLRACRFEEEPASIRMTRGKPCCGGMGRQIFGLGSGAIG